MLLRDVFGIALLLAFAVAAGNLAGDPGVGWHLRAGEWMSTHGEILRRDIFLDGDSLRPWTHDQWLSDVIFWQVFDLGGMTLLQTLLISIAVLAYVGLLGAELGESTGSGVTRFLTLAVLSPLASLQWFVRPVVFSFVFFIVIYRLARAWLRRGIRHLEFPILFLIFALWANLHPGFPMGFLLLIVSIGALLREERYRDALRVAAALVFAFLGSLVNPYGIELYSSISQLLQNRFFMQLNNEWMSPEFLETLFLPFFLILLILAAVRFRTGKPHAAFEVLTLCVFGALALFQRRTIPYFAVTAALPLAAAMDEMMRRLKFRLFAEKGGRALLPGTLAVSFCLLFIFPFWKGGAGSLEPFPPGPASRAVDRLSKEAAGRIFHSPDLGGMLTWYGKGKVKPSIDDRNQICRESEYERYFTVALARAGWREALSEFDWAVLSKSDPVRKVIQSAGWEKQFEEDDLFVFRRNALR